MCKLFIFHFCFSTNIFIFNIFLFQDMEHMLLISRHQTVKYGFLLLSGIIYIFLFNQFFLRNWVKKKKVWKIRLQINKFCNLWFIFKWSKKIRFCRRCLGVQSWTRTNSPWFAYWWNIKSSERRCWF